MACLLYTVSLISSIPAPELTGVAEMPLANHDANGLRVCWSEVANPETLTEGPARKAADGKYRQVLRELVAYATPLAFPFPAMVENVEALEDLLTEQGASYVEALTRLDGMVQYELTATWADDERADLATPVSGREYQKRRQEAEARDRGHRQQAKDRDGRYRARMADAAGAADTYLVCADGAERPRAFHRSAAQRWTVRGSAPAAQRPVATQ